MANRYPSTPSFGGAYPGLAYAPSQSQQNGLPFFAARPPATSPLAAPQPSSAANPQFLNASSFETNAQIPSPGLTLPSLPPHNFPPELLKQIANSGLPPPPPPSFPPVPIPNLGFSPFQNLPPVSNNPTPPQNHLLNNMTSNNGTAFSNPARPQPSFQQAPEAIIPSREEGELSDGELADESTPRSSGTISQFGTSKSRHRPRKGSSMGNALRMQREPDREASLSGREESGSSYDPPSVATPDLPPDSFDATNGTNAQVQSKSPTEMRELAKGALLSLVPHDIRFADIVREGVNPDLLQQLYEELGIRDPRAEAATPSIAHQVAARDAVSTGQDLRSSSNFATPTILSARILLSDNTGVQNSSQSGATIAQPQQSQKELDLSNKSPIVTATPNVAMERKDRIAQLLAAKTGRSLPVQSTAIQSTPPFQASPSPVVVSEPRVNLPPSVNTPLQTMPTQQTPKSVKNKAQTELVRQKMESLRREAEAKVRAQSQSVSLPPKPDISMTPSATSPAQIHGQPFVTNEVHPERPGHNRPPSETRLGPSNITPDTDTMSQPSYAYRIPGLFMTSDEAARVNERLSAALAIPADNVTHASAAVSYQTGRMASITVAHSAVPRESEPLTESNLANFDLEDSIARVPQKRPVASDLFDESTPPAKRPFGRKDSAEHLEIDVSDQESEDGSEGIRMEIDEDSQASGLLPIAAATTKGTAEQEVQPLSMVNKPAQLLPVLPSVSNSNVNVATPMKEKEKEKEDLWRVKSLEIDAMRKKIAEMEARKAKRSQSQAQSPQSSLPGTPAPLALNTTLQTITPQPTMSTALSQSSPLNSSLSNTAAVRHVKTEQRPGMTPIRTVTASSPQAQGTFSMLERRRNLQDGLPRLDAEVQATKLKLAQTRARLSAIKREAEKREAEIREARRREAEMMEEARRLEEQLAMGLSGRERFSEGLETLDAHVETPLDQGTPSAEGVDSAMIDHAEQSTTQDQPSMAPLKTSDPVVIPQLANSTISDIDDKPEHNEEEVLAQSIVDDGSHESGSISASAGPSPPKMADELRALSQLQSSSASDQSAFESGNSVYDDTNNLIDGAGEPSANVDEEMEDANNDYDGSVSMSDSGSDDYEPAPISEPARDSDVESDGYEPYDGLILEDGDQQEASEVDDDYEPAEEVEPLKVEFQPSGPSSINDNKLTEDDELATVQEDISSQQLPKHPDKLATDDNEGGLQLSEANTLTKPQEHLLSADDGQVASDQVQEHHAPVTHFTPYESPLSILKSFRFNPRFTEVVAGGYRSLTYSNKIDSRCPLCPTEAGGGVCTDPKCEEQHFRQMALPADDKILVEMSSANDFKQKEQRDQFLTGLKQVIAELRTKGVKEFELVADELASYRRRFLANLEDRTLLP